MVVSDGKGVLCLKNPDWKFKSADAGYGGNFEKDSSHRFL
jgi:hypothetical protein